MYSYILHLLKYLDAILPIQNVYEYVRYMAGKNSEQGKSLLINYSSFGVKNEENLCSNSLNIFTKTMVAIQVSQTIQLFVRQNLFFLFLYYVALELYLYSTKWGSNQCQFLVIVC